MTSWRAPNKRKSMQADLGPVIGDIRRPLVMRRQAEERDWVATVLKWFFSFMAIFGALFLTGVVFAAIVMWASFARGHGEADWIRQGGYISPQGERCCGEHDCKQLSSGDVTWTPVGWLIVATDEVIRFREVQRTPSPTGTFWWCAWGGKTKCLFVPPEA